MEKPDYETDHRHPGGEPCEPEGALGETAGGGTPVGDVDFADPRAEWTGAGRPPEDEPTSQDARPESDGRDDRVHDDDRSTARDGRTAVGEKRKGRDGSDDDWGFAKENRGMSTETKIGLTLVVLLLGTFGFVVWKKLQQRQADIVATRFDEHPEAKKKPAPKPATKPKPRTTPKHDHHDERVVHADAFDDFERFEKPKPRERPRRHDIPKNDDAGWAEIQPVSRESKKADDPFAELNPDNFRRDSGRGHGRQFDDFAAAEECEKPGHHHVQRPTTTDPAFEDLFAPKDDPACEVKPKAKNPPRDSGFAEYEFADDFNFGQPHEQKPVDACETGRGTGRHGWDQEPARLELTDFDQPRIRQTRGTVPAEHCPPGGAGSPNDGWGNADFEPIQRRPADRGRREFAQRDAGRTSDGWDDFETFDPIDTRQNRTPTDTRQQWPADDFAPAGGRRQNVDQRPIDQRHDIGQHGFDPVPTERRTAHQHTHTHVDPVDAEACEAGAPAGTTVYLVEAGDSYWTISRVKYGSAKYFSALAKFNEYRIANPKHMRPGMKVLCPPTAHLHQRYPKLCGPSEQTAEACDAHASGFFVGTDGQPKYRVGEEDTLSDIAHAHLGRGSRWVQIYELNRSRIGKPDTLRVGTVLDLPADASSVRLVGGGRNYR